MTDSHTRLRAAVAPRAPREDDTIRQSMRAKASKTEESIPAAITKMDEAGARLKEVAERVLKRAGSR